ncbi:hypothetical protein DFH08DRAFT_811184 [Mycena albidolilacea]|uniref:Protein kinase domain-containing protein n=1 Tax=Mycena albidolilacea TaxID=1033008 RepID=A0AAD6ZW81_9AGAR|nr:hypothetical protein DFH08DRAFT_811184 [Mycena albidolilacea]
MAICLTLDLPVSHPNLCGSTISSILAVQGVAAELRAADESESDSVAVGLSPVEPMTHRAPHRTRIYGSTRLYGYRNRNRIASSKDLYGYGWPPAVYSTSSYFKLLGSNLPAKLDQCDQTKFLQPTIQSTLVHEHMKLNISAVVEGLVLFLRNQDSYKTFLSRRGAHAQQSLDILQDLVDLDSLSEIKPFVFQALLQLSRPSGLHPRCMALSELQKIGQQAVAGGAFGDIWKGLVQEQRAVLKEFGREAIIWRQLWHPNILDVALGLQYLHEQKFVHGDLKGANILVTPSQRACIADFGLSTIAEAMTVRFTHTTATARGGTPRYQAPELIEGGSAVRNHYGWDVYAFACTRPTISETVQRLEGPSIGMKATSEPTENWDPEFTSKFRRSQQAGPLLPTVTQIERILFGDASNQRAENVSLTKNPPATVKANQSVVQRAQISGIVWQSRRGQPKNRNGPKSLQQRRYERWTVDRLGAGNHAPTSTRYFHLKSNCATTSASSTVRFQMMVWNRWLVSVEPFVEGASQTHDHSRRTSPVDIEALKVAGSSKSAMPMSMGTVWSEKIQFAPWLALEIVKLKAKTYKSFLAQFYYSWIRGLHYKSGEMIAESGTGHQAPVPFPMNFSRLFGPQGSKHSGYSIQSNKNNPKALSEFPVFGYIPTGSETVHLDLALFPHGFPTSFGLSGL